MEMMPSMMMELDELPEQFPLPFHHLSDSPFIEFTNQSHHTPPPVIIPSVHVRTLPRGSWIQQKPDSVESMREMIFRMAALQPVQIDPESVKAPKRRNVKISKDPQSVAARHRRERISERIRILQRLVPGGTKMDTASMLDEAAHYMKFLKKQLQSLEQAASVGGGGCSGMLTKTSAAAGQEFNVVAMNNQHHHGTNINHSGLARACGEPATHMIGSMELLR